MAAAGAESDSPTVKFRKIPYLALKKRGRLMQSASLIDSLKTLTSDRLSASALAPSNLKENDNLLEARSLSNLLYLHSLFSIKLDCSQE